MVVELLRHRHRRLPLRRVRGRLRHVRHRARGRLRQAEGPRRVGPERRRDRRARPARDAGRLVLARAPRSYFETYGAGREDLARIAVKNHHNGTLAPKSMLKREITVEDVLKARIISWPFGLYDCAAQSDGAAAAIITRARAGEGLPRRLRARARHRHRAVGRTRRRIPSFDFLRWKPTEMAATQVYAQAGITDPAQARSTSRRCTTASR